jgi:hypothetical protein
MIRLSFLLCLAISASFGATYFLDAEGGLDSNPGTSSQPWKSMAKAKVMVSNGDTVILRSGNYGGVALDNAVSRKSWDEAVTYLAGTGETPVFTSLYIRCGNGCDRYVELNGIQVISPQTAAERTHTMVYIYSAGQVRLRNMLIKGYGDKNVADTSWTWYGINTRDPFINDSYKMRGLLVENCEITGMNRAYNDVGPGPPSDGMWGGVKFINCSIHDLASSAIYTAPKVYEDPFIIEGNHIYNQVVIGDHHGTALSLRGSPVTVRGNTIHNYGRTTIARTNGSSTPVDNGVSGYIFENNLIYDNLNGSRACLWLNHVNKNIIIRNNTIVGRYRYVDGSVPKWRYRPTIQIDVPTYYDPATWQIYNNILVGDVQIQGLSSSEITQINGGNNIIWYSSNWDGGNNSVKIVNSGGAYNTGYNSGYFEESGKFFVGGADFNTYSFQYPPASQGGFGDFGKPHEQNLNDAYHLAPNSPAIGFGDPVNAPSTDLRGNLRDANPDAGCYEYGAMGILQNHPSLFPVVTQKYSRTLYAGPTLIRSSHLRNIPLPIRMYDQKGHPVVSIQGTYSGLYFLADPEKGVLRKLVVVE